MSPAPLPVSTSSRSGLVRLARGCWAEQSSAADLPAACARLLASSAEHTVVVLTTAGRLHRIWLPAVPDEFHLATAAPGKLGHQMTRSRRPEIKTHRRQLPPEDCVLLDGVAVTSLARTWRDLAAVLPLPDLVAAGDCVLRDGVPLEELGALLERTRRLPGGRRARMAFPLLDKRSRSRPESHLRVAVSGPDMPTFGVNEPIYRNEGGWLAEPDLSLPAARIVLEYQGAEHARVERMRKDISRARDLRTEGWLCIEYGPAEVFGRPFQIKPEVRAAVAARAPELLRPRPRSRVVT